MCQYAIIVQLNNKDKEYVNKPINIDNGMNERQKDIILPI